MTTTINYSNYMADKDDALKAVLPLYTIEDVRRHDLDYTLVPGSFWVDKHDNIVGYRPVDFKEAKEPEVPQDTYKEDDPYKYVNDPRYNKTLPQGLCFDNSDTKWVIYEKSVLDEASEKVNGPRAKDYGHPSVGFEVAAKLMSAYLGHNVTKEDVPILMMLMKLSRERHHHKRDNMVDIAGYAETREMLNERKKEDGKIDS